MVALSLYASWYQNNALPDPGTIGPTQDYSFPIRAKFWLSQQSILSPFAWATGRAAPPDSAANDLVTSLTYLMPGIGIAKAATASGLGITAVEVNTGDWINLGISTLSYRNVLAGSNFNPGRNFVPLQNTVEVVVAKTSTQSGLNLFKWGVYALLAFIEASSYKRISKKR